MTNPLSNNKINKLKKHFLMMHYEGEKLRDVKT